MTTTPSVNWCEVSAAVPVELAELAAEAFRVVATAGVSIEDPVVPLGPEEGVRLERRRPSIVRAYFPVDDRLGERLLALDTALETFGLRPELTTRTLREEEWAEAWKEHFHVERFGRRIVIRPSWRAYTPEPDDVVIELDPGMAFGTGQHPTTRMCLELLEEQITPGARVLDVGTGSGILSLAAAMLGASFCIALDIEEQAVQVARANNRRMGLERVIRVEPGTLGGSNAAAPQDGTIDLALANITANAVIALSDALARSLRPGAALIASGIVAERLDDVHAALAGAGLVGVDVRAGGDWRAVLARRPLV